MEKQKLSVSKGVLVLGLIVILTLAGALLLVPRNVRVNSTKIEAPVATDEMTPESSPSVEVDQPKVYMLEEVAAHADATSCWTVVRGNVYDITSAIDTHKGGRDKILSLCGIDGTSAFQTKHGGQEKPEGWLDTLKIGVLNQQS